MKCLVAGLLVVAVPVFAQSTYSRSTSGVRDVKYVLTGELDHVVNGVSHVLKPGMAGIVRPGDQVMHRVPGPDSVKVLVIWAPGGELGRLVPRP